MFLKNIWMWILSNVLKIQTETTQKEIEQNEKYANQYRDIDNINFNAIFSNKLANYTMNDSTIIIDGDNVRAEFVDKMIQSIWKKMKKYTAMTFGYGGIILVPYAKKGKLYYNVVSQERLTINKKDGELITGATVLAEVRKIKTALKEETYMRWTDYDVNENGNLIIQQRYTNDKQQVIPTPVFWQDVNEVLSISNVDRVLFGYIQSPVNNRIANDKYGVPITFGCESTIAEIRECMKQIQNEYDIKQGFVAIDKTALGKDGKLRTNLFTPIDVGKDDFWNVYDPAIRDSSYFARLQELFARLEKEIGVSRGILTEPLATYQNVDETKRALYDTLSVISAMRENIEQGFEDFIYACNILCNAYNLAPQGEYVTKYSWDYGLVESTTEGWQQLLSGFNNGVIKKEELRQFIYPSEEQEMTEKVIQEIEAKEPTVEDIINE